LLIRGRHVVILTVDASLEVSDGFAHPVGELGQLLGPEHQQDDGENDE
jgi:hypothetical protein